MSKQGGVNIYEGSMEIISTRVWDSSNNLWENIACDLIFHPVGKTAVVKVTWQKH